MLQALYRSKVHGVAAEIQEQKHRLCPDCGAYLCIRDNDRRLADHFGGKLHRGFVFLREKLTELKKNEAERREQRRKEQSGPVEWRRFERNFFQ